MYGASLREILFVIQETQTTIDDEEITENPMLLIAKGRIGFSILF